MYTRLNDSRDEIRLINILPRTSVSETVRCSMETVSLHDFTEDYNNFHSAIESSVTTKQDLLFQWCASRRSLQTHNEPQTGTIAKPDVYRYRWGDYAALSYTWGSPDITCDIVVNDTIVKVTENLEAALRTIGERFNFSGGFKLWIDAISINQQDVGERSLQVGKMKKIYKDSWSVFSWLGHETSDSGKAIELLNALAPLHGDAVKIEEVKESLLQNPEYFGNGCWLALHDFFQRPYWDRLWVIQEILLGASQISMLCGQKSIEWMVLGRGLWVIMQHLFVIKDTLLKYDREKLGLDPRPPWITGNMHHVAKDLWKLSEGQQENHLPFWRLLQVARFSLNADPRDKVYGLLAMMDPLLADNVHPDYKLDSRSVFTDIAGVYISVYKNLDFLRDCNPWGTATAPTWVPDWTWNGRVRLGERLHYSADGMVPMMARISEESQYLICRGFIIDEVDGLGARGNGTRSWLSESIAQPSQEESPYGSMTNSSAALARMLIGERDASFLRRRTSSFILNFPRSTDLAIQDFQRRGWQDMSRESWYYARYESWRRANQGFLLWKKPFDEYFVDKIPDEASNQDYWDNYQAWTRSVVGKRLASTKRGYVAWVPDNRDAGDEEQTRRGDLFCIIFGCETPVIIRPYAQFYQVVGEGYIQGMMDGEALQWLRTGECYEEDLKFC